MADQVTLTLTQADRKDQLEARTEIRASCQQYLNLAAHNRSPDAAEQIARAVLEYLDGEDCAEGVGGADR